MVVQQENQENLIYQSTVVMAAVYLEDYMLLLEQMKEVGE